MLCTYAVHCAKYFVSPDTVRIKMNQLKCCRLKTAIFAVVVLPIRRTNIVKVTYL